MKKKGAALIPTHPAGPSATDPARSTVGGRQETRAVLSGETTTVAPCAVAVSQNANRVVARVRRDAGDGDKKALNRP